MAQRGARALRVWLIDDTADHHATARVTLERFPSVTFEGFLEADEALARYGRVRTRPESLPQVVLMDYYLGDRRGDQVTRCLRDLQPAASELIIVGYSSVPAASERIIAAGADLMLRKYRDAHGRNPALDRWMGDHLASAT